MGEEGGGRRGRREKGGDHNKCNDGGGGGGGDGGFIFVFFPLFFPSWAREQQASFFFTKGGERERKGFPLPPASSLGLGFAELQLSTHVQTARGAPKCFFNHGTNRHKLVIFELADGGERKGGWW